MCKSIGHQPLWGHCPKGQTQTDGWTYRLTNISIITPVSYRALTLKELFKACMKCYGRETVKQNDREIRPQRSDLPKRGLRSNV